MMLCHQCGTELRPGARFCNVCGARQPESDPEQTGTSGGSEGEESGSRVKRPPRVPRPSDDKPRSHDGETASSIATSTLPNSTASAEGNDFPATADAPIPDAELRDFLINPTDDQINARGSASSRPDHPAIDWEREDTAEQGAIPLSSNGAALASRGMMAQFDMPPLTQLARDGAEGDTSSPLTKRSSPNDSLPWPLPPNMIVGGRYRVERLMPRLTGVPEDENQYIVADLQGYERCWSCGATYGAEAATDQFCQKCGADMLAREFVMTERMLPSDEASATEPDESGVERAATDGEAAESSTSENAGEEGQTPETDSAEQDARVFTQGKRSYRIEPRVIEPPAFPLGARIEVAIATDVGRTREGEHNEDSAAALVLTLAQDSRMLPLALGLVADGLGGHANGQDASRLVARTITERVMGVAAAPFVSAPTDSLAGETGLDGALLEAASAANAQLCAENERTGGDMGSTLVAALVCGDTAYLVNAGDSRAYVFDGEGLRRITTDHSLVEQLIQSGLVTPEERYTHPKRNQIFRSLGDDPNMQMDLFVQKLKPGMRLLLCSDGLWEMARDEQIQDILTRTPAAREACDALVRAANENGGEDNITAVLLDVSV